MKLIILDRDGVINEDSDDYIKSPDEWIPIPGSLNAISQLNHAGYRVAVVTNQSGIGRGYYDIDTLNQMHKKMYHLLNDHGGHIDAIFYCPHKPDDNCDCRKPKPGLLNSIAERYQTDLAGVPYVGDSIVDMQAANTVGATPYLVKTGKGIRTLNSPDFNIKIPVYNDLLDFATALLSSGDAS